MRTGFFFLISLSLLKTMLLEIERRCMQRLYCMREISERIMETTDTFEEPSAWV